MSDNESHILLFDGVCNLCNGFVNFIIKKDTKKTFKFAPLQSKNGQELLKKFNLPTEDFDSFVFLNNGEYFIKSSAGLHVLKELEGAWKLLYILILIPRPLRDFVYNIISKTRYKIFGKRNTCMVPTPDIKQRFL